MKCGRQRNTMSCPDYFMSFRVMVLLCRQLEVSPHWQDAMLHVLGRRCVSWLKMPRFVHRYSSIDSTLTMAQIQQAQ